MKKIILCFVILGMVILVNAYTVKAETTSQEINVKAQVDKPVDVGNKICPVSGEKIVPKFKVTYEYKGKIYNFCCAMCIDTFKSNPEKYIKKVNEELEVQSKEENTNVSTEAPETMHEGQHH